MVRTVLVFRARSLGGNRSDAAGGMDNDLNGAKRLRINPLMVSPSNHWNDWNVCSLRAGIFVSNVRNTKAKSKPSMLALLDSRARMHHYGALLMHKN